jgi:hypothetical protein
MDILSTRIPFPRPFPATGVIWRIVPDGVTVDTPPIGLSVLPRKGDLVISKQNVTWHSWV